MNVKGKDSLVQLPGEGITAPAMRKDQASLASSLLTVLKLQILLKDELEDQLESLLGAARK